MGMRLFFLSSMYQGNLDRLANDQDSIKSLSYNDHYNTLIENTTEFIGSYCRTFKRLGYDVNCSIANFKELQNKWRKETGNIKLNEKQTIAEQIRQFAPEILWLDNINFINSEWLIKIRLKVKSIRLILYYHCSPLKPASIDILKHVDFLFACTPGLKKSVEDLGFRAYLTYHAFDQDLLDKLVQSDSIADRQLIFSGSLITGKGFHHSRIRLIERLIESGINISIYANLEKNYRIKAKNTIHYLNTILKKSGVGKLNHLFPFLNQGNEEIINYSQSLKASAHDPVFGFEMLNMLRRSQVVLNFHGEVAGNYAGNMRLFEVTGVGSCLLTENKINIPDLFFPGKEIVVFDNVEDCLEKAGWLIDNESERRKIAIEGQKRTLLDHTVENRCRQIMTIFEKEMDNG